MSVKERDNPGDYMPIQKTAIARQLADNEMFLSFTADRHAHAFYDWWQAEGNRVFGSWVESHQHEYEGPVKVKNAEVSQ